MLHKKPLTHTFQTFCFIGTLITLSACSSEKENRQYVRKMSNPIVDKCLKEHKQFENKNKEFTFSDSRAICECLSTEIFINKSVDDFKEDEKHILSRGFLKSVDDSIKKSVKDCNAKTGDKVQKMLDYETFKAEQKEFERKEAYLKRKQKTDAYFAEQKNTARKRKEDFERIKQRFQELRKQGLEDE